LAAPANGAGILVPDEGAGSGMSDPSCRSTLDKLAAFPGG